MLQWSKSFGDCVELSAIIFYLATAKIAKKCFTMIPDKGLSFNLANLSETAAMIEKNK